MPRKPIEQKKLEVVLSDLVFLPTPMQRRVKAKFWTRFSESPMTDGSVDLPMIQRFVTDKRLQYWWQEPGFKEWFRNEEEFKERVEYLANMALDVLEEVMSNGDARESSRIAAAKLMMDLGSKIPKENVVQFADANINSMNEEQLREFLSKTTPKLVEKVEDEEN